MKKLFEKDIFQWSWTFESPVMFWWLLVIPVCVATYMFYKHYHHPKVNFSHTNDLIDLSSSYEIWKHILFGMQMIGIAFLITALAGPIDKKAAESFEQKFTQGIDIVITLDISASMLARDFDPDRLSVSKEKAIEFINARVSDRIGLAVYEGESYMKVPVTTDHNYVTAAINELEPGKMQGGTAIGLGLGTAINGLLDSDAKSKVIILLTDGVNNQGSIEPKEAAKIAETYGIKVYTIGVGSNQKEALIPVKDIFGRTVLQKMPVELDEESLKEIANITGGQYFRASSEEKMSTIYKEIDKLEKTNIKVLDFKVEPPYRFHIFVIIGTFLFFLPVILKKSLFRAIV